MGKIVVFVGDQLERTDDHQVEPVTYSFGLNWEMDAAP